MPRSYLNDNHKNWLRANYHCYENSELADKLTDMVRENNEKEISRLEKMMDNVTDRRVRHSMSNEIIWRRKFKGVTIDFVKHVAMRLRCPAKSAELIASSNRRKARNTNIKRWQNMAVHVDNPAEWLREFRVSEQRICFISNKDELKKIRNTITYFNRSEGYERGIRFSAEYIREAGVMRIIAFSNKIR